MLNELNLKRFFSGMGALIASAGIRTDAPPQPPSLSASQQSKSFWNGLKTLFFNV